MAITIKSISVYCVFLSGTIMHLKNDFFQHGLKLKHIDHIFSLDHNGRWFFFFFFFVTVVEAKLQTRKTRFPVDF